MPMAFWMSSFDLCESPDSSAFTSPKESEHSLSSRLSFASSNKRSQNPAFHAFLKSSVVCRAITLPNFLSCYVGIETTRLKLPHENLSEFFAREVIKYEDCSYSTLKTGAQFHELFHLSWVSSKYHHWIASEHGFDQGIQCFFSVILLGVHVQTILLIYEKYAALCPLDTRFRLRGSLPEKRGNKIGSLNFDQL